MRAPRTSAIVVFASARGGSGVEWVRLLRVSLHGAGNHIASRRAKEAAPVESHDRIDASGPAVLRHSSGSAAKSVFKIQSQKLILLPGHWRTRRSCFRLWDPLDFP